MPEPATHLEPQAVAPATNTQPRVLAAFIALAILAGPVSSYLAEPLGLGMQYLSPGVHALANALAGFALLAYALARHEPLPRSPQFLVLLLLLAPQFLTDLLEPLAIRAIPTLHETPWAVVFFLSLAAPLWLALLSALQWIPDQVPRTVAGAAIVGMGAVTLMVPQGAYTPSLVQLPVAALHLLLAILTVFSWSYARPRLAATSTAATASCFLLLTVPVITATSFLPLDASPTPPSWHDAVLPLLLAALLTAAIWLLWFWLLQRMNLAAFSLRALAAWTAAILPGFLMMGFLSWRVDAAVTISLAALVIALRARTADEQPLALGLAGP